MKKYLLSLLIIAFSGVAMGQYCLPTYSTTGIAAGALTRVQLNGAAGAAINDTLPAGSLASGSIDRSSAVSRLALQQGRSYNGTLYYYNRSAHTGNQVWVDFNNNNIFDDSEIVSSVFPSNADFFVSDSVMPFTINVPLNAALGTHRMRIRNINYYLPVSPGFSAALLSPCNGSDAVNQYYNGVTADYGVNITALTACAGTPHAGSVTAPSNVCQGTPFDLSLINDSVASGLQYQWYSRPPTSGVMMPISGATNRHYRIGSQSAATAYQAVITCSAGGVHDSSTVSIVAQNPFYTCYCNAALGGNTIDASIDSVAIAGTTLSLNIPNNPNTYTAVPDTGTSTAILIKGMTYHLFLKTGGSRRYGSHLWIDFDNNGNYDIAEYLRIDSTTVAGGTTYCSFTIPLTADTGLTGLRIRTIQDSMSITAIEACNYKSSGATEDLIIKIIDNVTCTGIPAAGTLASSVPTACPGTAFTILTTGHSLTAGQNYQWYSGSAGTSIFNIIAGATNTLYTVTSQAAATDYKLKVTCAASGVTDSTAVLSVGQSPYYLCYCAPATGISLSTYASPAPIDSVRLSGTALNNATPGSTATYARYYPIMPFTSAAAQRSSTYTLSIHSAGSDNYNADVWIDYDHSGTFEASEYYSAGLNVTRGTTTSATFTIPALADTGLTGLRIRTSYYGYTLSGSDACTEAFYGSTADYVINIGPGTPCIGRPAAGSIMTSDTLVCPTTSIYLSNVGALTGYGVSYQWVSRPAGSGSYSTIPGATSFTYTVASQIVSTEYSLLVTCSFSGITDTAIPATVVQRPFYFCYCAPANGTILNDSGIRAHTDSLSIESTTLNNNTPGDTVTYTRYYPLRSATTAIMSRRESYIVSLKGGGTEAYKADIWIDYDHSGTFDTSEYMPVTTRGEAGITSYAVLTIPTGADTGMTGMRVRTYTSGYSTRANDACSEFINGTTKDYIISIRPATLCLGTPISGYATSTSGTVCANEPFILLGNSFGHAAGITYQWIKSPAGAATYTAISGATSLIFTDTQSISNDYGLVAICATSGLQDTSILATVSMKPFYLCYCAPFTGTILNNAGAPAPVDSVAITGTTINNPTPGNTDVYQQYYPTTTTTTDSVVRGNAYNIYINSNGTGTYNADVWLDADRSGTFDAAEYYHVTTSHAPGGTTFATINIPRTSDTGYTGLRVRTSGTAYPMGASDACANKYEGATRDYIVRIAPGISCTGTPAASVASAPYSTVCPGVSFTLVDTGFTVDIGISYQWYSRAAGSGSFTAITGATTSTYFVASQTVATNYRFTTTCSASGAAANSNIVSVAETPYYSCYCGSPLSTVPNTTMITNVQVHGSTLHETGYRAEPYRVFGMSGDSTGTLQRSLPYTIDVKVNGGANFNAGLWIDYNHNSIFETSEYTRLDTNRASGTTISPTITIPATADTGITGIRIRATPSYVSLTSADACTNIYTSQTFDFKIKIDTLVRCSGTPNAGTITSSSPFACPSMTFQLSNDGYSVGNGITYQWLRRTTAAYSNITGATSYATTITAQTITTDYIVVARCSFSGLTDTSNVLRVIENPFDSCYCSPPTGVTLVNSGGHHDILITNVYGVTTMTVPEQSPDSTGYVAVPPVPAAYTTTLRRYNTYNITVYVNYTTYTITAAGAWIDYNHNSVFDSAEYVSLTQSADRSNWTANVNIPSTASLGLTGMRVVTKEGGTLSAAGSCSAISSGQVQDHIITIAPALCFSVSSATVTNITDTSAKGIWGRVTGSFGYQYLFDTFSAAPSGAGTYTTDTFATSGCLISGHAYYLHVRDSCDGGLLSGWITTAFNTLPCTGITALAAGSVTNTTATITWTGATGSTGYEYIADTSTAAPAGSGTGVSAGPVNLTGLTQGTTYYVHVRSGCPCNNHSRWQTITFTTVCDTITNLTVVSVTDTSAVIRWDSIINVSRYAYVINTTSAAPSGTGTVISDTTLRAGALTPGTLYYAHVRHNCAGGYSSWITIPFNTSRCDTVTGLTAIPSDTGVVFYWTPVSGSSAYYYIINTVAAPPVGTLGTISTATRDTVGALYSSTTYYIHLRTGCTGGSSGWVTVRFTTLACDTVAGLYVSDLCDTSATINWDAAASGLGYLYVISSSAATPTVAGSYTPINFVPLYTLTPGTSYFAHVRHICGSVDTSAWRVLPFTTQACDTVSGFIVTGINTTGGTISWTLSSCVGGYYYVIDNSPGTPSVAGTLLTTATVTETTLMPGTIYYVHIRVYCGGGVLSGWTTTSFTTQNCDPVSVSVTGITGTDATVNWAPASTAVGYEYAVDNSATPPSFGVYTTAIYYTATGLIPGAMYYAHVRELCMGGMYSTWVDEPFSTSGVGIPQVSGTTFSLQAFPNPAGEKITVTLSGAGNNGFINLTDLTGKTLLRIEVTGTKTEIDMNRLAAGVYFLRYEDDHHTRTIKVNKQ